MSLYLLTSNKKQLELLKNDFCEISEQSIIDEFQLGEINLVVSSAYKKNNLYKRIGNNDVVIIGTIFSEQLFNEKLLESLTSCHELEELLKSEEQKLFGHYVVIIMDYDNNMVKIIPDRVGMINTYYTYDANGDIYISNDIVELSKLSKNSELNAQGVQEFLMSESNIGRTTFFDDVYRLGLGNILQIENNTIRENKYYEYNVCKISTNEYVERINRYFAMFNNYPGIVSVDLSAGYDTRLIVSFANRQINKIRAFTNAIHGGVDETIAKVISERLDLDTYYFSGEKEEYNKKTSNLLLHGSSMMRDARRSIIWAKMFPAKYAQCDLALGGYGGEVVRAKYNQYENINEFVKNYYKAGKAEKICHFDKYSEKVSKGLDEYPIPTNMNLELQQNWFYTVAKMRIWGSGFIQMSNLYGEVIHPFMDWYLLAPLFAYEKEELKDAKLQDFLIYTAAPELSDIPINMDMNKGNRKPLKETIKKMIESNRVFRNIGKSIYYRVKNMRERSKEVIDLPCPLQENCELNFEELLNNNGKEVANRTKSILLAYKIVNRME